MKTSEQKDFYPELPQAGNEEAQKLLQRFKDQLTNAAEEVIGQMYTDIIHHIESDSWQNFRQSIISGLCDYQNAKKYPYVFQQIRQSIMKHHREELIADLNQDLLKEIEQLRDQIKRISEIRPF